MSEPTVRGGRSTSSQRAIIDGRDVTPSKDRKAAQPSNDLSCPIPFKQQFSGDKFPQIITEGSLSSPSSIFEPQIRGGSFERRGSLEKSGSLDSNCNTDIQPSNKSQLCSLATNPSYIIPQENRDTNRFRFVLNKDGFDACMTISDDQAAKIITACSTKSLTPQQGKMPIILTDGVRALANESSYEQCIRDNLTKLPRKPAAKDPVTRP